jgi:hypothetical protein
MGGAPEPDRALRGEADPLKETTNPTGASSGDGDVFRSPVEALESLEGPEGQVRNRHAPAPFEARAKTRRKAKGEASRPSPGQRIERNNRADNRKIML